MAKDEAGAAWKMSEVPIGAHVRNPIFGTWQQVADVVRVRDGSGDIRLTFTDGGRFVAGPNELVETRVTPKASPTT